MSFHVPNQHRIRTGSFASDDTYGNCGAFQFKLDTVEFRVIASSANGWEHVSVHVIEDGQQQTPTWDEMCFVKSLFWDEEDCVIQYHPAKKDYVNCHEHVLHLWRPIDQTMPTPPKIMV